MSNISFNLSGKIDSNTVDLLKTVKEVADSLKISFFIVGATARDIVLEYCYNVTPYRATMDIDIGVEVESWAQYEKLSATLVASENFVVTKEKQRFLFKNNRLVDIIPFGPITDQEKKLTWPPEHEIFMSMLGFEEAYANSMTVIMSNDPVFDVKIPTLAGLAMMKLISWNDNPHRQRDAEDLLSIMSNYDHDENTGRLYDMEPELLEDSGFDTTEAGIRLLGRDIVAIADPDTLRKINEILTKETKEQDRYRLVENMIKGSMDYDDKFDEVLHYVEKLKQGVTDIA